MPVKKILGSPLLLIAVLVMAAAAAWFSLSSLQDVRRNADWRLLSEVENTGVNLAAHYSTLLANHLSDPVMRSEDPDLALVPFLDPEEAQLLTKLRFTRLGHATLVSAEGQVVLDDRPSLVGRPLESVYDTEIEFLTDLKPARSDEGKRLLAFFPVLAEGEPRYYVLVDINAEESRLVVSSSLRAIVCAGLAGVLGMLLLVLWRRRSDPGAEVEV